jgi:hypothetical protein
MNGSKRLRGWLPAIWNGRLPTAELRLTEPDPVFNSEGGKTIPEHGEVIIYISLTDIFLTPQTAFGPLAQPKEESKWRLKQLTC